MKNDTTKEFIPEESLSEYVGTEVSEVWNYFNSGEIPVEGDGIVIV